MYNTCILSTQTKCENYLPEESETWCAFGDIEVKVDRIIDKQGYVLRHLLLRVSMLEKSLCTGKCVLFVKFEITQRLIEPNGGIKQKWSDGAIKKK